MTRARKLRAEDCAAGIVDGCYWVIQDRPEPGESDQLTAAEQLAVLQHACPLGRSYCGRASQLYNDLDRPEEARLDLERGCQYGPNFTACVELGVGYLDHKYKEPVAGRGQRLVNVICGWLEGYGAENLAGCQRVTN